MNYVEGSPMNMTSACSLEQAVAVSFTELTTIGSMRKDVSLMRIAKTVVTAGIRLRTA